MINKHCANDPIFGWCKDEPEYDEQPIVHESMDRDGKVIGSWISGGHCKYNKETCEHYTTHVEVKIVENPHLRIIKKGGEKVDVTKKKSKKTKAVQGSFFGEE